MKHEFGKHYLIEYLGCSREKIALSAEVERILLLAAKESKTTVLSQAFTQFEPHGVSGILFIAESHFAIHTWPEANYAGVDIFTCGTTMQPQIAIDLMKREFEAAESRVSVHARGF